MMLYKEIRSNTLDRQFYKYQSEYEDAALRVLRSGWYVLGKEVESFENKFSVWNGSKYCVGVNSGLDALILALKALGITAGDEVIVPANTYIATVMGITANGARPVFVEPDEYYNIDVNQIEKSLSNKTKAVLVVHLYGQMADIEEIKKITSEKGLYLVEDCAQAHGCIVNGKKAGTFGDIGCFSFFPTKNLGAFGDAGAVVTDNKDIADRIRMLRNYGSKKKYFNEVEGMNSRLDEIQAALLSVKLEHIDEITSERVNIANYYLSEIKNVRVKLPQISKEKNSHVFHLFSVLSECRTDLIKYLEKLKIGTQIHYPIPPHLAQCYAYLGHKKGDFPITENQANKLLSIPLYNGMTEEEMEYVVRAINEW